MFKLPGTMERSYDAELATQSSDAMHPMNLKPRRRELALEKPGRDPFDVPRDMLLTSWGEW